MKKKLYIVLSIVILVFSFWGISYAAITKVHVNATFPPVTPCTTCGITVSSTAAGNTLIVVVQMDSGATLNSIADTKGDSFFAVASSSATSTTATTHGIVWFATNIAAGTTNVTTTLSGSVNPSMWVYEVSGLSTNSSTIVDVASSVSNLAASTTVTAPQLINANAAEFYVSSCGTADSCAKKAGNSFTDDSNQNGHDTMSLVSTTTVAQGGVWTQLSAAAEALTVAFKSPASNTPAVLTVKGGSVVIKGGPIVIK